MVKIEVIKLFSCLKFSLLIDMKMPTIVGIFMFINKEICLARQNLQLFVI